MAPIAKGIAIVSVRAAIDARTSSLVFDSAKERISDLSLVVDIESGIVFKAYVGQPE